MVHDSPWTLQPDSTCHVCLIPSKLSASFVNNTVHTDTDLERVINTGIYIYSHILVRVMKASSFLFHAAGAAATTGGPSQSDCVQPNPPVDTGEHGLVLKGDGGLSSAPLLLFTEKKPLRHKVPPSLQLTNQLCSASWAGACTAQPG